MTTSQSPLRALKAQADNIAAIMKRVERGEKVDARFAEKIEAARDKESIKFGVVMDDKVITIDMPWSVLHTSSEVGLAEYVLKQMRDSMKTPAILDAIADRVLRYRPKPKTKPARRRKRAAAKLAKAR